MMEKKGVPRKGAGQSRKEGEKMRQPGGIFRILVETAGAGIAIFDREGKITFANDRLCLLTGYSREDITGSPFAVFVHKDDLPHLADAFQSAVDGIGRSELLEFRVVRKDGQFIWVHSNPEPIVIDGQINEFSAILYDITGRKQLEEALAKSEARYRTMLDQMQDSYYEVDLDGSYTFVNESAGHSLGYSREEMIGKNYRLTVPEEDVSSVFTAFNQVYRTGIPDRGFVHRVRHKDNSLTFSEVTIDVIRDGEGEIIGFKCVGRDITRRRQMEMELRRLASVVRYSSELVNLATQDGRMIFLNEAGARMLGIDPGEVDKYNVMDVIPDHLKGKVRSEVLAALSKGDTWEGDLQYLNLGTGLLTEVHAMTFVVNDQSTGAPLYIANVSLDISARKRAEEAQKESEEQLKVSLDNAPDGIYINDLNGHFLYGNRRCEEIIGYRREELIGRSFLELNILPESSLARAAQILQDNIDGKPTGPDELDLISRDGRVIPVEINTSLVPREGQRVVLAFVRDITERHRVESALRESEEKYRLLVENTLEAIGIAVDGTFIFVNRRTVELTGYSQEELTSRPVIEFVHPDDRQTAVERYLQRLKGINVPDKFNFRVIFKAGGTRWVELSAVPITWEGRLATLSFMTDITDRRHLEEEQQRVAKLESVGLLAAGIAHDFNNILTAILGNISLAATEATPGSELLASLEQAEKASMRAKDLTQQLLTFSRGGAPVTKLASLAELLKDTVGFALRGSNVKCHLHIPTDLWNAEIDTGQVSQVIHNLAINAQQAMPTGGVIDIRAENMAISEAQSLGKGLPIKAGNYVRVAVTDHGIGIDAQHLDKIFDPFFTTKQKGSGLGLATSFSIARQHGGHLSVESEPGVGSTFYLYLPASTETASSERDKQAAIKAAGKARILVMDDEHEVREVAGRMLRSLGYLDTGFAADGAEAVRLYKAAMESGHPFTVAILDLTIAGGIGGRETIRDLLKIDPRVKAIVSSGYADDPVIAKYRDYGFSGMVAKPYTLRELGKMLHEVIG